MTLRPADVERLWASAEPLETSRLPEWLGPEDADLYRRLRDPLADAALARLEEFGCVVDESGTYLREPAQPVFTIGCGRASGLNSLDPTAMTPVTRDDVTDVVALYVADPFLLRDNGGWHMFLEVWNWHADKGEIGHAVSADGLDWVYDRIVLAEEFHLSYPYVFEWGGERWLVPESFQAGAVRLYRATRFPHEWSFERELIAGDGLVDASPFRFGDRWWMLVGCGEQDTLRLFGADELYGPWCEHPASPVVAGDAGRARPAGRVVVDGAGPIRFAQDCRAAYGAAVRGFEITLLTPTEYAERELDLSPLLAGSGRGWNAGGMHHIDAQPLGDGWLACVDGWSSHTTPTGEGESR